jgi:hypothetical protein
MKRSVRLDQSTEFAEEIPNPDMAFAPLLAVDSSQLREEGIAEGPTPGNLSL